MGFIFSKFGVAAILAIVVAGAGAYVMHIWNAKTIEIEQQKAQIIQYKADIGILKQSIVTQKKATEAQDNIFKKYVARVSVLEDNNNAITNELLKVQSKLNARNMDRLKRSSHSELVLRILNNSIIKQTLEYNSYGTAE